MGWPFTQMDLCPFCSPGFRMTLIVCALRLPTVRAMQSQSGALQIWVGKVFMATVAVQSGLQLYLRQINETPLLTANDEKTLARRIIHQNDFEARERMVKANLRLVVNIAKHYVNR